MVVYMTSMGTIHRRREDGEWRWEGVELEAYPTTGVTKQVLIGPADGARRFAMRYFELAPGSVSSLDTHPHDHGVLVLCGEGIVRLGEIHRPIGVGDVVYVSSGEIHQFTNTGSAPL